MKYFMISSMCHYNKSVLYTVRHIRNDLISPTLNSCFWGEYPYKVRIDGIIAATRLYLYKKLGVYIVVLLILHEIMNLSKKLPHINHSTKS